MWREFFSIFFFFFNKQLPKNLQTNNSKKTHQTKAYIGFGGVLDAYWGLQQSSLSKGAEVKHLRASSLVMGSINKEVDFFLAPGAASDFIACEHVVLPSSDSLPPHFLPHAMGAAGGSQGVSKCSMIHFCMSGWVVCDPATVTESLLT